MGTRFLKRNIYTSLHLEYLEPKYFPTKQKVLGLK